MSAADLFRREAVRQPMDDAKHNLITVEHAFMKESNPCS